MSHFIVAGAQGGKTQGAAAPNRLEIRDLIKNREQFSLYIQALSKPPSRVLVTTSPLIPKQEPCIRRLSPIHFLILLLVEFMASLTRHGSMLGAISPSKEGAGVDTALTQPSFSRLGTGPTLPCTRLASFHEFLHGQ
jgi:hypothetical protein